MASEEERAAILAEYKAASAAGYYDSEEEDEADFDPSDDSDESEEEMDDDYAILDGSLSLNEEGKLMYSGFWSMKSDPGTRSKFKSRSQNIFYTKEQLEGVADDHQGDGPKKASPLLFDLHCPTQTSMDSNDATTRRTILFDGFFFVKSNEHKDAVANGEQKSKHGEKIKERDIEICFRQDLTSETSPFYNVTGRGYNTYGPFVLEGKYTAPRNIGEPAKMELHKKYGSGGVAKDTNVTRGSKRGHNESEDDEDEEYEEKTGFNELIELTEDANLSVEELRKKYYGGGQEEEEDDDGGGGKMPAKKARLEESDDSDCGF